MTGQAVLACGFQLGIKRLSCVAQMELYLESELTEREIQISRLLQLCYEWRQFKYHDAVNRCIKAAEAIATKFEDRHLMGFRG
jgi:hypothetical protein